MNSRLVLALIILLGAVLRALQLDFQPLWWDEGYSVFFATRDLADMIARTAIDIHPPLYYALMQAWLAFFGTAPATLRILSLIIGVATIPLLYLVARTLFNPRVGLVAAFLLAISPLHIYYSQELRMYGLVTLLALGSVYLQLKILLRESSPSAQTLSVVGYVTLTALALYTQYFAGFIIAAQIIVVLYLKWRARWQINLVTWLLMWLAVGILYLPWLLYAGPKLIAYVTAKVGIEQYSVLDPFTYLAQHLAAFSIGHITDWTWLSWGALFFVLLGIVGIFAGRSHHIGEGNSVFAIHYPLTAIYLLVPLALGFLVNLLYTFHPVRYERLLLFAAPFFLIYIACGIIALFDRERALGAIATAAVAVLCALSLFDFYTVERYPDEDYRPLIAEMETIAAPNDLVYAVYPWQIGYLESYYRGAPLNLYEIDAPAWISDSHLLNADLSRLRRDNPRAWVLAVQNQGRILEDRLLNEYINDYTILDQTFGNTRLAYFAQGSTTDFELTPIQVAPDLTLRVQYSSFEPHDDPTLALARFLLTTPTDQYAYSLRVVNRAGEKIAQQDSAIPSGNTTVRRALALPQPLAPGDYTLQLVLYRRSDGVPLIFPNGAAALTLSEITK